MAKTLEEPASGAPQHLKPTSICVVLSISICFRCWAFTSPLGLYIIVLVSYS